MPQSPIDGVAVPVPSSVLLLTDSFLDRCGAVAKSEIAWVVGESSDNVQNSVAENLRDPDDTDSAGQIDLLVYRRD